MENNASPAGSSQQQSVSDTMFAEHGRAHITTVNEIVEEIAPQTSQASQEAKNNNNYHRKIIDWKNTDVERATETDAFNMADNFSDYDEYYPLEGLARGTKYKNIMYEKEYPKVYRNVVLVESPLDGCKAHTKEDLLAIDYADIGFMLKSLQNQDAVQREKDNDETRDGLTGCEGGITGSACITSDGLVNCRFNEIRCYSEANKIMIMKIRTTYGSKLPTDFGDKHMKELALQKALWISGINDLATLNATDWGKRMGNMDMDQPLHKNLVTELTSAIYGEADRKHKISTLKDLFKVLQPLARNLHAKSVVAIQRYVKVVVNENDGDEEVREAVFNGWRWNASRGEIYNDVELEEGEHDAAGLVKDHVQKFVEPTLSQRSSIQDRQAAAHKPAIKRKLCENEQ